MGVRGPRRLQPFQILAAIYPCLFAAIYWLNLRHYGRDTAKDRGVTFLTFVTWIPILLLGVSLFLQGQSLYGLEPLYWFFTIASAVAIYLFHKHMLIKRRIAFKFLRRYETMHRNDRLWIKSASAVAFAAYWIGFFTLIPHLPRHQPVVIVMDGNSINTIEGKESPRSAVAR